MRRELPSGRPAALARPDGEPARGMVVVPDIFGLTPAVEEMLDRFAADHRWAACAVEPFPGHEDVPRDQRLPLIGQNDDDVILADLAAAADELGTERTGVMGFCQGGMWAFKAAGTGRFDKAVAFYGMVTVPWARDGHAQPREYLARPGRCPVLSIMGGKDKWTPSDDLDFLATLPDVEIALYPEADHAFAHDPKRDTFRPADARDAWAKAMAFLA